MAHSRVGIDYHIEVAAHYYSVPHRFARAEVDARLTARTVEIFLKGERIAAHMRGAGNHKHTTVTEHMPSSHRRYAGWTIERIRADARLIGPATAALCELILEQRPHPEQGFRACLGVVRLARPYGAERLEAAERAIDIGARTYGSVKSILDNHLDRRSVQKRATDGTPILHANVCASPNCASRPASRMSTIAVPAVSTASCSRSSSKANGSALMTIWR
jgi:transposase